MAHIQSGYFGFGLSCVAMSPESICIEPAGWPGAVCIIDRTVVILSARAACRGNSSVKCKPGIFVGMERKGPRYSLEASGLGSYVSS